MEVKLDHFRKGLHLFEVFVHSGGKPSEKNHEYRFLDSVFYLEYPNKTKHIYITFHAISSLQFKLIINSNECKWKILLWALECRFKFIVELA